MKTKRNPLHDKYTVFTGSYQAFTGTVVSPDDPRVKGRVRRGRPADSPQPPVSKKKGGGRKKK
jgi:hypothetical protein